MPNDARIEELARLAMWGKFPGSIEEGVREALRTAIREAREGQIRANLSLMAGYGLRGQECYEQIAAQLPTKKEG